MSRAADAALPGRAVDPARYALAGRAPAAAVRPADRDEVVEVVRAAARDRRTLVPWGGGVALAHEPAAGRYDLALDLTGLDRIVEYDPEDLTLTAEAGVTLATLRDALAARGQELPLEGAHAARATLGGTLAADASGPRRLRFGAPHDRILGARFVLGDGTAARSGGRVVKNVAGYALHRLLCGSRGGLAVIVEASLKLAPAPAARVGLLYDLDEAALADATRWAWLPRLEPACATVLGPIAAATLAGVAGRAGSFTLALALEDDTPWVAAQEQAVTRALGPPRARVAGDGTETLVRSLADLEEQPGARLSFTGAGNTPAALAPLLAGPGPERLVFHAPAGRLHLFPAAGAARACVAAAAAGGFALRDARAADLEAEPAGARAGVLALRRRIAAALDPGRRLALGPRWEAGGP